VNVPVREVKSMSTAPPDEVAEHAIGWPNTSVLPAHENESVGAVPIPVTTVDAPLENPFGP
jgi:hypothetical protein